MMIGLAVALGLAAMPEPTDLTARMRASAAAAQALQGPLDGAWTLEDNRRRPLFILQITNPAGGAWPLSGAWRRSGASLRTGPIDAITRQGDRLSISFADDGRPVRISLRRNREGGWSGAANEDGHDLPVTLRPSAAGASPR